MVRYLRRLPIGVKAVLILLFVFVVGSFFGSSHDGSSFRFTVANDRLFAIRSQGFYGSESGVWTTDDLGETWRVFDCPKQTRSLSGNGDVLLALTSSHEVWRREDDGEWKRLVTLPGSHHYDILCDGQGRFLVSGINSLSWHAPDGESLRRVLVQDNAEEAILFGEARFAGERQNRVIVETNTYSVAYLDLESGELLFWGDNLTTEPSMVGSGARLRQAGNHFLLENHDGVFTSNELLKSWQLLTDEFRHTEYLLDEHCRDLVWHDVSKNQWLVATNAGIKLMQGAQAINEIFADTTSRHVTADDHDLILQIVPYRDAYFVSFARLRDGALGVRIPKDLKNWNTMRLTSTD